MQTILNSIKLLRYLIVFRVNRPLANVPSCFSMELSQTLAALIAERLPTRERSPWHKYLTALDECVALAHAKKKKRVFALLETDWPLNAIILPYPGKNVYGKDELIAWEFKLFQDDANHEIFLEVVLPSLEKAGYARDIIRRDSNMFWGGFDISHIFVAQGKQWLPIATDGKLDVRSRPDPQQWAKGLDFGPSKAPSLRHLTWLTPYDFSKVETSDTERNARKNPSMLILLEAFVERMAAFAKSPHKSATTLWDILSENETKHLKQCLEEAATVRVIRQRAHHAPERWPGLYTGEQTFSHIPSAILPLLELASIVHIGRSTHFGCGTFMLS